MNPEMEKQLILLGGQLLLTYGPAVAEAFVGLFHKETVSLEDWKTLFALAKNPIARVVDGKVVVPPPEVP